MTLPCFDTSDYEGAGTSLLGYFRDTSIIVLSDSFGRQSAKSGLMVPHSW